MSIELRNYQRASVEAIFASWSSGVQRPAIVLATGLGKTVIFSTVAQQLVREHGRKPVVLVHRDELVRQTVEKLRATDPGLSIGIIQADVHQLHGDITVASVQTLIRRLGKGKRPVPADRFTDVLVDECHHATAPSYMAILKFFGCFEATSGSRALGVTATLQRADGTPLGHVWQEVCSEMSTTEGMVQKWLVPAHAERAVLADLDLSKVKSLGGDWAVEALGGAMFKSGEKIAEKLLQCGRDHEGHLRRTIVFAPTVLCANLWAQDFAAQGIRCAVVTGETPTEVRQATYKALDVRELDAILSCMVLTEGFDLPSVEVAVIGRPTKSITLYQQMVGRVLRPSMTTGKSSALVLDVCGVMNDKLTTLIDLGLPPQCECACGCDFEHLCTQTCKCPRSRKGKLKLPCIICAKVWMTQLREDRVECYHYEGAHVVGCHHRCEGLGRPGIHDEDDDQLILDPLLPEPEPIVIDEAEITTQQVELWETVGQRFVIRRAPEPKKKPRAWRQTASGRHYLPSTSTFPFYVFLHQEEDGTWTVGEKATKGQKVARRIGNFPTLSEAIVEANDAHPTGGKAPKPLAGLPSELQLATLQRAGVPIPSNPTKQLVSDMLSDLFATRSLG